MDIVLSVDIPGQGLLELECLVLDLNGTLTVDGVLLPDVASGLKSLAPVLRIFAVTADTLGTAEARLAELPLERVHIIERGREAESKLDLVDELGGDRVVAIGNGANDTLMLRDAALGIAVMGGEGVALSALQAADVVVASIADALGLLLEPPRLISTLRR